MTFRELRDIVDLRPGLTREESAIRCYATDILESFMADSHLYLYDDAKGITETDLLKGAKDWEQYSRDGFSLIYTDDVRKRLYGFGECACTPEELMEEQAERLEQASCYLLGVLEAGKDIPWDGVRH